MEVGRGGELIVEAAGVPTFKEERILDTVKENPDMVTARAGLDRLCLAYDAGVLAMTVDALDSIEARNSLERMLAAQLAALHMLTMKNAATAASFVAKAADPVSYTHLDVYKRQATTSALLQVPVLGDVVSNPACVA